MMMKIIFIILANSAFARKTWFEEKTKIVPTIGRFDISTTVDVKPYINEAMEIKNLMTTFSNSPVLNNYKTKCGLQPQLPKVDYLEDDLQGRQNEIETEYTSIFEVFREVEPLDNPIHHDPSIMWHHLVKRLDPFTIGAAITALISVLAVGGAAGYGISQAVQAQDMEGIHRGIIDEKQRTDKMADHITIQTGSINQVIDSVNDTQTLINKATAISDCHIEHSQIFDMWNKIKMVQEKALKNLQNLKDMMIDAWASKINKRFFDPKFAKKMIQQAEKKMKTLSPNSQLVDSTLAQFYSNEVSIIVEPNSKQFHTIIHMAMYSPSHVLTYYKFHSYPISYRGTSIEFTPNNDILAINHDKSEFVELTETYLSNKCKYYRTKNLWGCPDLKIFGTNHKNTGSCLMSLYTHDTTTAAKVCPKKMSTNHEIIYQYTKDSYKIINPSPNENGVYKAKVSCPDQNRNNKWNSHFVGLEKNNINTVPVDEGCFIETSSYNVLPKAKYESSVDIPTPNTIPIEITEDIHGLMQNELEISEIKKLKTNIHHILTPDFGTIELDLYKSSTWKVIAITVGVVLGIQLLMACVLLCCYFKYCRKPNCQNGQVAEPVRQIPRH